MDKSNVLTIGVLALQGAFAKHREMLAGLGVNAIEVRTPEQLDLCAGLIIPGGESTTMVRQMAFVGMREALQRFAKERPCFGTCAGLILMARHVQNNPFTPLGILDVEVQRNAYGSQADSFVSDMVLTLPGAPERRVPGVFIRAPRIDRCGKDVVVLARQEGLPVLVQQGHHLGCACHPELSDDSTIHSYFVRHLVNS